MYVIFVSRLISLIEVIFISTIHLGPRWPGSKKTLSGTLGSTVIMYLTLYLFIYMYSHFGSHMYASHEWVPFDILKSHEFPILFSLFVVSLSEAFTEHIDNLFLPLVLLSAFALISPCLIVF